MGDLKIKKDINKPVFVDDLTQEIYEQEIIKGIESVENGETISVDEAFKSLNSLRGIINDNDVTLESIKEERLRRQ